MGVGFSNQGCFPIGGVVFGRGFDRKKKGLNRTVRKESFDSSSESSVQSVQFKFDFFFIQLIGSNQY